MQFSKVLVATDFSVPAQAAIEAAAWLSGRTGATLTVAHVIADVRRAIHESSRLARHQLAFGDIEAFERDIRRHADEKLRALAASLPGQPECLILLGEPYAEIIHAVQKGGHDLVVTGTRGQGALKKFLVGSTATRLVRNCPAAVWVVREGFAGPPKTILVATDLSPASQRAAEAALVLARAAGASVHLLYVADKVDIPPEFLDAVPEGLLVPKITRKLRGAAQKSLEEFASTLAADGVNLTHQVVTGVAWQEINKAAKRLGAELVAMSTTGRSGIPGIVLGNTAERVLSSCNSNILAVKAEGFVSPIAAPFWPIGGEAAKEA